MSKSLFLLLILVCAFSAVSQTNGPEITQGSLFAYDKKGKELGDCPLRSTKVQTDISGFIARVRVTQEFENQFAFPIEAVYTFPLSENGAVDDMTMNIGSRVIRGKIMKRAEARAVYEQAKAEGKTASLLDQERPNIFTQSVANIMPGDKVTIEISYVETLKYEDGAYEFVFPMTVSPRYIPASSDSVDATNISPPIDSRSGHDITLSVNLNAGVPIDNLRSNTHDISISNLAPSLAQVSLKNETTIPNKDFVLRYDVIGKQMSDSVLTTRTGAGNGFFSLILSPPERISVADVAPKEIVFVLDTSGSMQGFPIEKAKEAMKIAIDGLYPNDMFNLITFAGETKVLFDEPVPATQENIEIAQKLLESQEGGGGTEMMDAIRAALAPSDASDHIRIVCFMTDGEVGNDRDIIAEVKKHPNARVFSFGIGDSVNRFLLDNIAKEGRGEAQYILLEDQGSAAAKQFTERIRNPYLTDISIDWNGLPATGVYPRRISDLFGAKPVVVYGRYSAPASGIIRLRGKIAGQPYERSIAVTLPVSEDDNSVLASLWARTKVDELMSQSWNPDKEESDPTLAVRNQVTKLGLDHHLMTQYTSFVAVEERMVNRTRNGRTIRVPVYAPAGTVFENEDADGQGTGYGSGNGSGTGMAAMSNMPASVSNMTVTVARSGGTGNGGEIGSGNGNASATVNVIGGGGGGGGGGRMQSPVGNTITSRSIASLPLNSRQTSNLTLLKPGLATRTVSSGVLNGKAVALPKPAYPADARALRASGAVQVSVTIDEKGNVISAIPISGHPSLRAAALAAANQARFAPTMLSGKPVKVVGVVTYNFVGSPKSRVAGVKLGNLKPVPQVDATLLAMSPEERHTARLKQLMHWWVYAAADRVAKGVTIASEHEDQFVQAGIANVQIDVSIVNQAVRERLKAAGYVIDSEKGTRLMGHILVEKLASLVDIDQVILILPAIN